MDALRKLTQYFSDFPGIGPRQAKRFVYYLLSRDQRTLDEISDLIKTIRNNMQVCLSCFRVFPKDHSALCSICRNPARDHSTMMVVSRDVDLENIEKTGIYDGVYFVLGGTIPILEQNPEKRVRLGELLTTINKHASEGLKEIILAMSTNPEGENTIDVLHQKLDPLVATHQIKISMLGRGLSTGTELEYSDTETIKNALKNRV